MVSHNVSLKQFEPFKPDPTILGLMAESGFYPRNGHFDAKSAVERLSSVLKTHSKAHPDEIAPPSSRLMSALSQRVGYRPWHRSPFKHHFRAQGLEGEHDLITPDHCLAYYVIGLHFQAMGMEKKMRPAFFSEQERMLIEKLEVRGRR